jgi:phosphoglycerol transferase MdoB-like AlkP superfamily enzyme
MGNALGPVALIVSVIGFVLACTPQFVTPGWVLLGIALVLGIVGVLLPGPATKTSTAAIVVAVAGAVVSVLVVVFGVSYFLFELFWKLLKSMFNNGGHP